MLPFFKKKFMPLLALTMASVFLSFKYAGDEDNKGTAKRELVLQTVMKGIREGHFAPRPVDDTFSLHIYGNMFEKLDHEKKFFTAAEVAQLAPYQFRIDDEINNNTLEFADRFSELYLKSIDRAEGYYKNILQQPFTFDQQEVLQLNGDKLSYAADEQVLKERWRQLLKYQVLARYVELKDRQAKDSSKNKIVKTNTQLEADARASVLKIQNRYFKALHKIDGNQLFTVYMNSITETEDPHTNYLPPKEKRLFDERISGSFFGIGAMLKEEDGKIKISSVITGSPCWKQGELKAGDEIRKVGQGAQEPVDIQGYETEDVIALIRGNKGTEVRLTVKKMDGSVKVIPIIRGEVLNEEIFAKSAIVNGTNGQIGYIYLPEFYADFNHISGRRCAADVAAEVQKLKNAGVKGIILDLRYNSGGSLADVVDMAGLFIGRGPVVQVKTADAPAVKLGGTAKDPLYDGPLAIMVNEGSASASEILAAAMQDYKRAVIVGTTTFGKGTVQHVISLDDSSEPVARMHAQGNGEALIGSLKITIQKFYRVNGGSTQLKGVTPDIYLPDPYAMQDKGERNQESALQWDQISPADYHMVENPVNVDRLAMLSSRRVAAVPAFKMIDSYAAKWNQHRDSDTVSLTETGYRKDLEESNAAARKLEEIKKKIPQLNITNLKEDMDRINANSASVAKNNDWLKALKTDAYLSETVKIINDLARQS